MREQRLRWQVEKWLGLGASERVQVTAVRRSRWRVTRCVLVEALLPTGSRTLYFFRHDDGSWRVYPPTVDRRTIGNAGHLGGEKTSKDRAFAQGHVTRAQ